MYILFYRYGNICEPAVIETFQSIGLSVVEECAEITNKSLKQSEILALVETHLQKEKPIFVFSINFFPVIAELCHIYRILYLCWTVDSPVMELFSKAIQYDTNRIFLFDYAQYQKFSRYNSKNIFYLPLASNTSHYDKITSCISAQDYHQYNSDISFIGSLYNEKDSLRKIESLSEYARGSIDGITEASINLYGYYPAEEAVSDRLITEIKEKAPNYFKLPNLIDDYDRYLIAQYYLGYHIASEDRIRTLNALAEHFHVDLFTCSDTSLITGVHVHNGVQTLTEMPKVFHLSKINLNMTIKSIQTGLPLRIFDIMGCGGFVMTNYQSEITEYFDIGTDLETYSSMEELIDKCAYYLSHEQERKKIATCGYEKVKSMHTYIHRIQDMLNTVLAI